MRIAAIALFACPPHENEEQAEVDSSAIPFSEDDFCIIAEMALAFGPTTSFDIEQAIVWVDITGCGHLHGPTEEAGERPLAKALSDDVRALGYTCRVAVATGSRIAAAVAKHAPFAKNQAAKKMAKGQTLDPLRPLVVPHGREKDALRPLPLSALPVADDTRRFLFHVGFRSLGDLQKLPRASLGTRLGREALTVMPFLDGDDRTPLKPYLPPEVPEEKAELEYGIQAQEALLFVAKTLCDRMGPRLLGRAMGASRLEIVFKLDHALLPEGYGEGKNEGEKKTLSCSVTMPSPLQRGTDLLAVLKARLESVLLPAPALAVMLRVTELARMEARPLDLFVPEAKADKALPRLTAELAAELGETRVGVLVLGDTWEPEHRGCLVPYGVRPETVVKRHGGGAPRWEGVQEPTRYLPKPKPLATVGVDECVEIKLQVRLEAVEWWKKDIAIRDYGTAWLSGMGIGWVCIDRTTGERLLVGWVD